MLLLPMLRSYLRYIGLIEMISRRLTKTQKDEILEAYRAGENTNLIAKNYNCTPNTTNRTVKTLLSESEYILLKKNRAKIKNKSEKVVSNKTVKQLKKNLGKENSLISFDEKDTSVKVNDKSYVSESDEIASLAFLDDDLGGDSHSEEQESENHDMDKNDKNFDSNFEEIAPLISNFDFNLDQQKEDFKILNYASLPESVYMIVDKKVELELQPISDLPEWSFLPEDELERNAILLFSNQRSAKRICSRNQRVIKIPNTSIFKLSKSYLISKGVTRLILEDSIIGLDN